MVKKIEHLYCQCSGQLEPALGAFQNFTERESEQSMKTAAITLRMQFSPLRLMLYGGAAAIAALMLFSCATNTGQDTGTEHRALLVGTPTNFDVALRDNQTALSRGKIAPDIALYNAGYLCAHPSNPKKDYLKAINSFQTLVAEYPRSSLVEPAKTWIQVLEQQQKVADERRKLAEDKRALEREREMLAQERQKLNYASEKSRQLDLEIEKRRRQTLSK